MWFWHKDRHTNQWNRIERPEINPCIYNQMIFDKGVNAIQWGKEESFQQIMRENLYIHVKEWSGPLHNTMYKN